MAISTSLQAIAAVKARVAARFLMVGEHIEFGIEEGEVKFVSTVRPEGDPQAGMVQVDVHFPSQGVTPLWLNAGYMVTLVD